MVSRNWLLMAAAVLALGHPSKAQVPNGPARDITSDLVSAEIWCRLSPNGTKASYTSSAGANDSSGTYADVWICDLDGSNRQRIAPHLKATEEYGSVSSDGTKVVLHSFANDGNGSGQTDIWVYDLVSGVYTKMTTNTAYDAYPCWSPDGTRIVFLSQRNHDDGTIQDYQLWMINADKPENTTDNIPVQLTNFKGTTGTKGIGYRVCFYDNTHIVFLGVQSSVSYTSGSSTVYPNEIYMCEAKDADGDKMGDNMVRLTDTATLLKSNGTPCKIYDPSAAMGRVVFQSDLGYDGQYHFFSLDPTGVNKDVWQITGANYAEDYGLAQGSHLIFRMGNNDTDGKGIGCGNTDVGLYDLVPDAATPNSTITGRVICQLGQPMQGVLVNAYNGPNLIASTTTDADGNYTLSGLRAGGYVVRFVNDPANTTQMPLPIVSRGCVAPPDGSVTVNAFTSPSAAPRPGNVMATIDGNNVVVTWQPPAESTSASSGFTYQGFKVWRSDSEFGPYTQVNADLIPKSADGVYRWVDTSVTDLTKAFYKVTCVTTSVASAPNGAQTLESMFSEFSQAANNLVYNGSWEVADSTPVFAGWMLLQGTVGTPAKTVDNTFSVDTTDFITGSQSLVVNAGATVSGSSWVHSYMPLSNGLNVFYCIPTDPRVAYVNGTYVRFKDVTKVSTNTYAYTALAYATTEPNQGIPYWYDSSYRSNQVNGPTGTATSIPWTWAANTSTAKALEFATYTRFSNVVSLDNATCTGTTAKALFDDTRYQVKRVNSTGIVWGHIRDAAGSGVGGVLVSDGTHSTYSDIGGTFALRGVPTGMATITFSYPGQADIVRTVNNIGGYCFQDDVKYSSVIPISMGGVVYLPTGQPAPGAKVRLINTASTPDGVESTWEATTGADGTYTFNFSGSAPDYTKRGWFIASKGGYSSTVSTNRTLLGQAGKMMFNFTLGQAQPVFEIAKTTTAPNIDGTVNPSEWAKSAVLPLAFKFPTASAPTVAANAYALWDESNLYLAVVADEPNVAGMSALASGLDGTPHTWADDHFELLIDPTAGAGYGMNNVVWHVGVNANPTGASGLGIDDGTFRTGPVALADVYYSEGIPSFYPDNSDPAVKIDAANNKWSMEVRIPFMDLAANGGQMTIGTPVVGDEWRGLIGRYRTQDQQYSSTTNLTGGFVNAPLYNTWRFVNTITPPAVKGDLNGDGSVTAVDATTALKIAAGLESLGSRLNEGDVVADSKVNIQDAIRILRKVDGTDTAW